jgi:2-haloacid dehalogenase
MALAVKALFFDVFGTLVDWRSSIAREAEALLKPKGLALDYLGFADAWRGEYQGAMEEVRAGRIAFCKLDVLHRRNLELTLKRFGVTDLSEDDKRTLNLAWHRLDALARGGGRPRPPQAQLSAEELASKLDVRAVTFTGVMRGH